MCKDLNEWKRKEFEALPHRKWNEDIGKFDSLIILPKKNIHDSGFSCMDFVAVLDGKPKCLLAGGSDIIHLGGIGGYGYNWLEKFETIPDKVKPVAWSIDCLKKSKLLRLFTNKRLRAGAGVSSFEIYSTE